MTFYAIYYQSDYPFTNGVQTFTAPIDGVYQIELWGANGGGINTSEGGYIPGGNGGYTKAYINVKRGRVVYVFVGGSGSPVTSNSVAGGYNGGGYTYTCSAGPHSGSGGGMTHVSYKQNLATANPNPSAKNYWDPTGTIAVAGGGGGAGKHNDANDNYYDDGLRGHAGGSVSNAINDWTGYVPGATQTSGWSQGSGQSSWNASGGGGGWWGGYSHGRTYQTTNQCFAAGTGGTGYITNEGRAPGYESWNQCIGGNSSRPAKPSGNSPHGYARITLMR